MAVMAGTEDEEASTDAASLHDLYLAHHWSLVRLASLLLHDQAEAEEAVQDAFVKAYVRWDRLRQPDRALAYLRSAVLNGARTRLRHVRVVARTAPPRPGSTRSAEAAAIESDDQRQMIEALRRLPRRQAECLALRYYVNLSEAEIATTLGISTGSVKTHVHRGLAALATRLEPTS